MPREVRDKRVGNGLMPSAKYVYLCLVYIYTYDNKKHKSHQFISRRFGVSQSTYSRAISALQDLDLVKVDRVGNERGKGYHKLIVTLNWDKIDKGNFDMIPNHIINTDVFTNDQKLFILLIWKYFRPVNGTLQTDKSPNEIINDLEGIGIGVNSAKFRIRELTGEGERFVPLLIKIGNKLMLNHAVDQAISSRCIARFEEAIAEGSKLQYPIYKKPEEFEFKYVESEKEIIKTTTK